MPNLKLHAKAALSRQLIWIQIRILPYYKHTTQTLINTYGSVAPLNPFSINSNEHEPSLLPIHSTLVGPYRNLEVRVGNTEPTISTPPSKTGNPLCWSSNTANPSQLITPTIKIRCSTPLTGKWLSVQLVVTTNALGIYEVRVWSPFIAPSQASAVDLSNAVALESTATTARGTQWQTYNALQDDPGGWLSLACLFKHLM